MNMKRLLIVVDYQNDFVCGSLGFDKAKELEKGKDSENVKKITKDIMEDFYHIELPIEWETE